MREQVSVLLVHLDGTQMAPLEASLESRPVEILRAQSRHEAAKILAGTEPPHLVFVDATLPDGSWADVITLAKKASAPVNAIVVARLVDARFYVEVIEAGAYDLISPPFGPHDLDHVLRCALQNVLERREAQARADHAAQRQLFPGLHLPESPTLPTAGPIEVLRAAHKALKHG